MFDRLLKLIINGPRLTLVLALGAILGGYLVLQNLAVDVFPDIKVPRVTIQTEAGGLTAEEVEQRITIPIESAVNGLTGVKGVRSSSGSGLSFVWVDFDWSADPDVSRYRVFERLGQVRESLPPGIEPEIAPAISVSGEIMMIALTSSATNVTGLALRELAEYKLRNHLLAIPGIAQVVTMGGNLPEICVGYKPRVLAQYGLGLSDIAEAVSSSCTWASAGYLPNVRGEELPVRQVARADAVDALKSVWVPNEKGEPLTLGALADISLAGAPRRGSASFNGKDAVVLSVQKAPGGNTLELTKAVETALDTFLIPEGVCLERDAYRQRDFINVSIDNGKHMVRDAVLIVILVLGLTLLNVRALLIVLITMPVSIGLGLVFFPWAGLGVNIMTLGGFAVAVGDIVDGAIIYTEIFRRRLAVVTPERVKDELASASKAVTPSVFFSASIIMLVFLPVLFLTGLEGQFFRPLAYAYLIIFGSSIVSAFAVTPVLALIFGKRRKEAARLRTADNRSDGTGHAPSLAERLLQAIYTPFLSVAIRFPKSVTLLATIVTGAALWWATGFGSSFLPPFHEDTYTVFVSMVPGTSLDESERVSENVSEEIRKLDGVLSVTRRTGRAERDQHAEPVSASELIVRVDLAKPQNELKAKMNAIVKAVPGASGMIGYPIAHRISAVLSGSAAELSLNIFGEDPEKIRVAAKLAKDELAKMSEVADVQANREILIDTLKIDYDLPRLAQEGLSLTDVGEQVSAAYNGRVLDVVVEGQNRRDITLRLAEGTADEEGIRGLLLKSRAGRFVRLGDVARVHREEASNLVVHENGRRLALITLNPAEGISVGELVKKLGARLGPMLAEYDCTASFGGSYEASESAKRTLGFLSLGLLVLIFVLLSMATESCWRATMVLATVPLALVGAVIAVEFSGRIVSVASLVGFVTVIGFTIRNGLLLVGRYRELAAEGRPSREAVELGSRERMVPILMTSLTTVFGLVPIAAAYDLPGGELLAPLAAVQLGGLIVATLAALVALPALARLMARD